MKKILLFVSALAGLFLAGSCQRENLKPVEEKGTVTFSVTAPAAVQTRAIADGMNVDQLVYEVWLTKEHGILTKDAQKLYQAEVDMEVVDGVNKATLALDLVNDQKFTVLFWAQVKSAAAYNTKELTAVTYAKNEYNANDESLAAFYAVAYVDDTQHVTKDGAATTGNVVLRRPFAQLNLGTLNTSTAYDVVLEHSQVSLDAVNTVFNVATSEASEAKAMTFKMAAVPADPATLTVNNVVYEYATMNYVFASDNALVSYDIETRLDNGMTANVTNTVSSVPLKENYRTNIIGNLLTSTADYEIVVDAAFNDADLEGGKYGVIDGKKYMKVENVEEFNAAFTEYDIIILAADIELNSVLTRSTADASLTLKKGQALTIDLNGHKLSSKSTLTGKNYNMIDVNGATLTVKNGTMEYVHEGDNMGWNASTNIFNVTAGGILNLEGVTAKNLGGSDMAFVAHLNNWGEVTLNVDNCTLESTYVPVRVFNSGPNMNNVDIKNSSLTGVSAAFWVHNYTVADFGSEAKAEAQKALLNIKIYNQGNKFSPDVNGIRYGFTNSVRSDAYGITKSVSEDGTEVTLGSVVEDGLIRRGVAGTEENQTIKKVIVEEGVTVLYDRTFRRFYALETVELPSTLTTIGAAGTGVFQSCSALKNIVLPESVTALGTGTFYGCTSLESINIPASVTRIEENCLRETGINKVEFHDGVTYFGTQAFRDCKQLKEVIINAPSFTIEPNAFGVMAGPLPAATIYVANAEMKAYLETTLTYGYQFKIVAPEVAETAEALSAAAAAGKNVVLGNDLTDVAVNTTAPYGNKYGIAHNGGVIDGKGFTLDFDSPSGDNYGIMTSGGTIKNITVGGVFRGIMIMNPTQDIVIDNAIIGDEDVCYSINTGEGDGTHSLYISNTTIKGWNSYGTAIKDVTFTNCTFALGEYYTNVWGRLTKPYVNAVYENCEFCSKYYIDLSQFGKDGDGKILDETVKLVLKNCTVNGIKLTKDNWTSLIVSEGDCGEGQISIESKDGSFMTASNVLDYVVIE